MLSQDHNLLSNTAKTGSASSTSTRFSEDDRFRPGITALSKPATPRKSRNLPDDSNPHHRVLPPDPRDPPSHYHYIQNTIRSSGLHTPHPNNPHLPNLFVEMFSKDQFIHVTSTHLDQHAELNADNAILPTHLDPESVFYSVSKPDIPTRDYIRRLVTYTQCSPAAFVVMLIYLDRICRRNPRLRITPYNMHRLLVTALTLACKVLDDRCFSNVHYAKVGGIPTAREMNRLELQFLKYVDYRLHVYPDTYQEKIRSLESQPPPTSPISVTFEGSSIAVRRAASSDSHSMVSTASGISMSRDNRYAGRTETSPYPTPTHANTGMEKWHAWRSGVPPPGHSMPGRRAGEKQSGSMPYSSHMMHNVKDMSP